jgi:hypothetical protein
VTERTVVGLAAAVILLILLLAQVGVMPAPTEALEAWTTWLAKFVGIVVAARVLWAGAKVLEKRI